MLTWSDALGIVSRLWPTISDPNFIAVETKENGLELMLRVFDLDAAEKGQPPGLNSAKGLRYKVGTHRFAGEQFIPSLEGLIV